jgi:hypothetical protein
LAKFIVPTGNVKNACMALRTKLEKAIITPDNSL